MEDPQILGASAQNLFSLATRCLEFVHPWAKRTCYRLWFSFTYTNFRRTSYGLLRPLPLYLVRTGLHASTVPQSTAKPVVYKDRHRSVIKLGGSRHAVRQLKPWWSVLSPEAANQNYRLSDVMLHICA